MISIIVTGAGGKMGRELLGLLGESKEFCLVGAIEKPGSPLIGLDSATIVGSPSIGPPKVGPIKVGLPKKSVVIADSLTKALQGVDVENSRPIVVDFSDPSATSNYLKEAEQKNIPMVIGTTGFKTDQLKNIRNASEKIPLVVSPNMSLGVNTLFRLVGEAASILGKGFNLEILEAHHRFKKDAPSGTAVRIAEILAGATGRKYPDDFNFHREGIIGERPSNEIGIQVMRGGDIVGEHSVFYCGDGERLEIRHVATSRKTFALGALRAASWVKNRKPGFYDMTDVLEAP